MTSDFKKIESLEQEIREKDDLIEKLSQVYFPQIFLSSFLHEENNLIVSLEIKLINHFEECNDKGVTQNIDGIRKSFKDLRSLINSYSNYLRGRKDLISVKDCVEELMHIMSPVLERSQIELLTNLPEEVKALKYPKILTQGLVNILLNSVEAYRDTNLKKHKSIYMNFFSRNDTLIVEITDHGRGIDAKIIDKIWLLGFSTNPKRVGLGLVVTKHILDDLQGHIGVESKLGEFTKFTLTLPLQEELGDEKNNLDR